MRYLITGGSGYIGGRLTDELSGRDETELIVNVDLFLPVLVPIDRHSKDFSDMIKSVAPFFFGFELLL